MLNKKSLLCVFDVERRNPSGGQLFHVNLYYAVATKEDLDLIIAGKEHEVKKLSKTEYDVNLYYKDTRLISRSQKTLFDAFLENLVVEMDAHRAESIMVFSKDVVSDLMKIHPPFIRIVREFVDKYTKGKIRRRTIIRKEKRTINIGDREIPVEITYNLSSISPRKRFITRDTVRLNYAEIVIHDTIPRTVIIRDIENIFPRTLYRYNQFGQFRKIRYDSNDLDRYSKMDVLAELQLVRAILVFDEIFEELLKREKLPEDVIRTKIYSYNRRSLLKSIVFMVADELKVDKFYASNRLSKYNKEMANTPAFQFVFPRNIYTPDLVQLNPIGEGEYEFIYHSKGKVSILNMLDVVSRIPYPIEIDAIDALVWDDGKKNKIPDSVIEIPIEKYVPVFREKINKALLKIRTVERSSIEDRNRDYRLISEIDELLSDTVILIINTERVPGLSDLLMRFGLFVKTPRFALTEDVLAKIQILATLHKYNIDVTDAIEHVIVIRKYGRLGTIAGEYINFVLSEFARMFYRKFRNIRNPEMRNFLNIIYNYIRKYIEEEAHVVLFELVLNEKFRRKDPHYSYFKFYTNQLAVSKIYDILLYDKIFVDGAFLCAYGENSMEVRGNTMRSRYFIVHNYADIEDNMITRFERYLKLKIAGDVKDVDVSLRLLYKMDDIKKVSLVMKSRLVATELVGFVYDFDNNFMTNAYASLKAAYEEANPQEGFIVTDLTTVEID